MFAKLKNKLDLIFTKSWSFLRPKNKLGLVSFVILSSLVIVFLVIDNKIVRADFIPSVGDIEDWFAGIFFAIAGFFIKLTFWVLKFVIEIAGYNGYIDSPAVTVGWVMIRDMTNMIFIVVLLIISFGTILGLEHYEWKKMLVKVIMAAVIVNFSRIICGVIIDIGQVVMLTFVNGIAATASGNLVNMFNIQEIFKLGNGTSSVKLTSEMTFIASVAALVFGTMMLVTMGTFLLLLMARMAMLWVLIVMSPFAFVLNVLPQTEKYASQWWGEFGGNVIAGPVIVFFLWLSFVTVGTGAAHDEIVKNNALKGENLMNDPSDPQQSTGITEVMSWEKMANFVIAIAMLLAGAKMASELGAAGGEMMGKAKDIGKKVAMYASGYQAARWGAGKAVDTVKAAGKATGKFALMKAPLIGGDAWKRRGKGIAARAKFAYGRFNERRDIRAKKMGDWGKDEKGLVGGMKRFLGRSGASFAESAGRKDKRVEDWEKAAKLQQEIVDENYSVSSDSGGQAKLQTDNRLKRIQLQAEGKKKEKYAKEEDRMGTRTEFFHLKDESEEIDHEIEKSMKLQRPLTADEDKKLNEKIAKKAKISSEMEKLQNYYKSNFKNDIGEQNFDDKIYADRGHAGIGSKAKGLKIEEKVHRAHEIEEAEARDQQAGPGGGGYADQVRAKHAKEDQERAAVGSYDKSMNKLKLISEKFLSSISEQERATALKLKNDIDKALENPSLPTAGRESLLQNKKSLEEKIAKPVISDLEREKLLKQRNDLQMANIKRGQMFGVNGQKSILATSGLRQLPATADITEKDLLAHQANFLSTQLNESVKAEAGAISHALERLTEIMGPGYMENMVDSLSGMADDGAETFAGMFRPVLDSKTNKTKIKATRIAEKKDSEGNIVREGDYEYIQGKRDWATSQSKLGKQGFEGSVDHDENGKALIKSARALDNISNMFAGLTKGNAQRIDPNSINTIVEAIKNGDNGEDIVKAIGKQADSEGVKILLKRINDKLADSQKIDLRIVDTIESASKSSKRSVSSSSKPDEGDDEDVDGLDGSGI